MHTFSKIESIFYSGSHAFRGNKNSINDIVFLLDEGYLMLNNVSIATKREYLDVLDSIILKEHVRDVAAGDSKNHRALKLLGGNYLKKKGFYKVLYEYPFLGYYPDVMSNNTNKRLTPRAVYFILYFISLPVPIVYPLSRQQYRLN